MTDHTDLRRRLLDLADRIQGDADRDLVLAGLNAIEALVRERDALDDQLTRATVARAQETIRAGRAEAERDEARALLREIPKCVVIWKDNPETRSVRAHIDALLAKTEGTT